MGWFSYKLVEVKCDQEVGQLLRSDSVQHIIKTMSFMLVFIARSKDS